MRYRLRIQRINSDKVQVGFAKGNISTIIELLGRMGYAVINYFEDSDDGIFIVKTS